MSAILDSLVAGLPYFLLESFTTFVILGAGLLIYLRVTPHDEIALIREGNTAASVSLGGAIVGMALPLAICLAFSQNVLDILVWGGVTLFFQLVAYKLVDILLKDLSRRIVEGEMSAAVFLASIKLATAVVNAAAIT